MDSSIAFLSPVPLLIRAGKLGCCVHVRNSSVHTNRILVRPGFERNVRYAQRYRIAPQACAKHDTMGQSELLRVAISASTLPVAVVTASALALLHPTSFAWFQPSWATPGIMTVMLCMGLTLRGEDVAAVASQPKNLLLGAVVQYGLMPFIAALIARLFALPPPLATGLILVGCCPGSAASNIVCLFAGADVAYSVLLTLTSTALSAAFTPALMLALAGQWLPLNAMTLFASVAQIVIAPLLLGAFLRTALPRAVRAIIPIIPHVAVALTGTIVGYVMSKSAGMSAVCDVRLIGAIATLHILGAAIGLLAGLLARIGREKRRTLSIKVCMHNSILASSLATAHFANPLVAVPGVISATIHSVLGSILAGFWRIHDFTKSNKKTPGLES